MASTANINITGAHISEHYYYDIPHCQLNLLHFHNTLPFLLYQETTISPQGVAAMTTPQALIRHMQGHSIHCIASGGQAPNFKFFFYAQKAEEPSTYLVECIVNSSSCKVQLKIKADDQSTSQAFSELFQSALSKFGFS